MGCLRKSIVWAEMARRKVRFHPDEEWDQITLWGLFRWCDISSLVQKGELITNKPKRKGVHWVRPSQETWEKHIKPLVEQYSLDELTQLAGW